MTEELSYSFSQVSALSVTERSGCTSVSVCECVGESRFTSTEKLGCKTSRADRGGKKKENMQAAPKQAFKIYDG